MALIRSGTPRPVVRFIDGHAFVDRPEPEPDRIALTESPVLRRQREAAARGEGLSSAAARARTGRN